MTKKRRHAHAELLRLALYKSTITTKWLLSALMLLDSFYLLSISKPIGKPLYFIFLLVVSPPVIKIVIDAVHPLKYEPCFPMLCHDQCYNASGHLAESISIGIAFMVLILWQHSLSYSYTLYYYTPTIILAIGLSSILILLVANIHKIKRLLF